MASFNFPKSENNMGKPIYKWAIYTMAMLNNQMVFGMPFAKCLVYLWPSFPIISHGSRFY